MAPLDSRLHHSRARRAPLGSPDSTLPLNGHRPLTRMLKPPRHTTPCDQLRAPHESINKTNKQK